jgi:hypothetical protein
MSGTKLIRIEESTMEDEKRVGSVLMTLGKVLLWTDFLLLMFVYVGWNVAVVGPRRRHSRAHPARDWQTQARQPYKVELGPCGGPGFWQRNAERPVEGKPS